MCVFPLQCRCAFAESQCIFPFAAGISNDKHPPPGRYHRLTHSTLRDAITCASPSAFDGRALDVLFARVSAPSSWLPHAHQPSSVYTGSGRRHRHGAIDHERGESERDQTNLPAFCLPRPSFRSCGEQTQSGVLAFACWRRAKLNFARVCLFVCFGLPPPPRKRPSGLRRDSRVLLCCCFP